MNFPLPGVVERALAAFTGGGYAAHLVGGCVRDLLLGKAPHDWDIATEALPEEVIRLFSGERVVETGLRHGTVTVILEGLPLEITTYRTEGAYRDHRHPEEVCFTRDLTADLARRDFTINAMAYHPTTGLVDPFGGEGDLAAGILRAVGEGERRFSEDALRILRGLRFAATLGFALEENTGAALLKMRPLLSHISPERVSGEVTRLLCGDFVGPVLADFGPVLWQVFPILLGQGGYDQEHPYHCFDLWGHTVGVVAGVPGEPVLRLAALLHDCGKPFCRTTDANGVGHYHGHAQKSRELAEEALWKLRFDRGTVLGVSALIGGHHLPFPADDAGIRRLLSRLGEEQVFLLLALRRGDLGAKTPELVAGQLAWLTRWEERCRAILAEHPCLTLSELQVDGRDLLALGIPPGPAVGARLTSLLDAVLEGKVDNRRENLLDYLKTEGVDG